MNFELNLTAFDWILVAYLAVAMPVLARHSIGTLRRGVTEGDPDARVDVYRRGVIEQWIVSAVLLVAWWRLSRPLDGLGLTWPTDMGALAAWVLAIVGVIFLAFQMRSISTSEEARETLREQLGGPEGELGSVAPSNERELRWFSAISVTAGINEELVYRGFLMAVFAALGGTWLAVLGSVAVFTLGHSYQPGHLPKVAGVGLAMALLYLLGGSVWPLMVLHTAIDLSSGWMMWRVLREDAEPKGLPVMA